MARQFNAETKAALETDQLLIFGVQVGLRAFDTMLSSCENKQWTMDYVQGKHEPHYPVPALVMDSCINLGQRWSNWMDVGILCDTWSRWRY